MDSNIVLQYNPMVGGLRKYDVERRMRGDRQTFMLIIRRLLQQDAGQYECQVKIQNQNNLTPVKKIGILTVQGEGRSGARASLILDGRTDHKDYVGLG